ncbi:hypothetical protein ABID23_000849 [Bartonella silvatica]|uniref:Uncharacterized protein n=1 Tax=Bartonella silvatica TaxID=357760 RepID=A0ABV2HGU0_9HYPH
MYYFFWSSATILNLFKSVGEEYDKVKDVVLGLNDLQEYSTPYCIVSDVPIATLSPGEKSHFASPNPAKAMLEQTRIVTVNNPFVRFFYYLSLLF